MWTNLFAADSFEEEAQLKVVVSLTMHDLIKMLKQGEVLATDWLEDRANGAEFRIVVQGKRVGVGADSGIIDLGDGGRIIIP